VLLNGGTGDVERLERDAALAQRGEQRLLPFRVFVQDDEIGLDGGHFRQMLAARNNPG
jgi:hypothetical protein